MCYCYYQESGKFADLSKEYSKIRLTQGLESAIKFYLENMVKFDLPKPSEPCMSENTWWIYNAAGVIASNYGKVSVYGLNRYDAIKKLNSVCGGTWNCYYEY
jgi:hypothetical protein